MRDDPVEPQERAVTAGSVPVRLCLNMIVKNEMANLERCLAAVAEHISCWVIGDTGSTDGTQDFIRQYFAKRGIPGELHAFPFVNFEQARNAALDCAEASALAYDYLLLDDADMELVVEDPAFRTKMTAAGYRIDQRTASGLVYGNTRFLKRGGGARYRGVTHEYVDVPGGTAKLAGVWYRDHASGSNRVDKFERDIRLLLAGLEAEPDNKRYVYYLAQSYRDAHRNEEAAETYAGRAALGGWEEEAWHARLQEARMYLRLNDGARFLKTALAAFNQRPSRAEPLFDLAKYYRERSMNEAAMLFAEAGLKVPPPKDDVLFIEDFVYRTGLLEEFSIAANYARDERKDRGFAACNYLALSRTAPQANRNLARANLKFYVRGAAQVMPFFAARPVDFAAPEGFVPLNPSVAQHEGRLVLIQRTVNYRIVEGRYLTDDGGPIRTRNFLLHLDDRLAVKASTEILPPADLPPPASDRIQGFEDARLFSWRGALWQVAVFRELDPEAMAEQSIARLAFAADGSCRLADWRMLRPQAPRQAQKNWMPRVDGDALQLVYNCDPTRILDDHARLVGETAPPIAADGFRGGSQLIPFDGGWLALVHEVSLRGAERLYHHRFVWFDAATRLARLSRPFFLARHGIEFAAGLAWHPDSRRLVLSFGVEDRESWLATVAGEEVRAILDDARDLPRGDPRPAAPPALRPAAPPPPAPALSERALNGAAFDQAWQAPRIKLIICSTERTGSYLLCRALIHHGIGVPHEYFNNLNAAAIGPRLGIAALEDGRRLATDGEARRAYIDALLKSRTRNGVFAAKIHWYQYARFLDNAEGRALLDGARFIHLHREDLLDQAISLHVSRLTGRWDEDAAPRTRPAEDPQFFDAAAIAACRDEMAAANEAWRAFFARHGDAPLTLTYEQLRDDLPGVLRRIIAELGLPAPAGPLDYREARPPERQEQGVPAKAEIRKRFLATEQKGTPMIDSYRDLAPFLAHAGDPVRRRQESRDFDARIAPYLDIRNPTALPQIHCFYEVMSETATHASLKAATQSMRAAGHPVRVWTYSPQKLDFLRGSGVEICPAADVVPRGLFERVLARSEIRYFSDVFRYAVLYEQGGLWMDSDVVMVRPFPYRGDYFFNLQWSDGGWGHFTCGNVIYAKPMSRHFAILYERAIDRFLKSSSTTFGDAGPKLLSDYLLSEEGRELRPWLFSPMFFNPIDWTERDRFARPLSELGDYLGDERVFGVHLWNGFTNAAQRDGGETLLARLSDPERRLPRLATLADAFDTDKNRHTGNRHFYARVYDRLLSSRRFSLKRLMEIGLCRGLAEGNQSKLPSVDLWLGYFPFAEVVGLDLTDFSAFNTERFSSLVCDQSKPEDVAAAARRFAPGSFDVIIDDGSHASADQQRTLRALWPLVAPGGWFFIEDLDWQPPGEDRSAIQLTKTLLREIAEHGAPRSIDPHGIGALTGEIEELLFFDSHYELVRAMLKGGLVALKKRGGSGLVR
jgi:LPS sulfotransferase NodH/glycosyltransferase involved in cell wall biosynthesis